MSVIDPGVHADPELVMIRRLRNRRAVDRLDELRAIRSASRRLRQGDLAREVGLSQAAVSKAITLAAQVPDLAAGFSGATPYEIAQRYAAGELTEDQVVDELGRWPYAQGDPGDGVDWLTFEAGEWALVERALSEHLISEAIYAAVQARAEQSAAQ